jgi:hypothetical protein
MSHLFRQNLSRRQWTPRSFPGLQLWLDPSNAASVTQVGGSVSRINDLSGNGRYATQATPSNQPTLVTNLETGLSSLRFTSANSQVLTFAGAVNPGASFTVFAVMRAGGSSGTNVVQVLGSSSNSVTALLEIVGGIYYAAGAGGYIHGASGAGTAYHLVSATFTGGSNSVLYVDGKAGAQSWTSGGATGNIFDQLGRGDGAYCNGEVGEILLYSGVLSAGRLAAIHDYLWRKWLEPLQTTHIGAWATSNCFTSIRLSNGLVVGGSVDNNGNKVCDVVSTTGIRKSVVLQNGGSYDDHGAPCFVQRPDGAVVAIMTGHQENYINVCISAKNDPTRWSAPTNIANNWGLSSFTYSAPLILTGESGQPIYNFFRGSSNVSYYTKSTDGGVTWTNPVRITASAPRRPYISPVVNGTNRIDFILISGNPNDVVGATVNVYHMYYTGGHFYTTEGSLITIPFDINGGTLTPVFDGSGGGVGINHDIGINASGRPVLLYSVYSDATTSVYWRAEWSGSAWAKTLIATAGATLTGGGYTNGEGCFDPDNTDVVYLSRETGSGVHQIWKYTWDGSSWSGSALTNYAEKSFHPRCVKGASVPRLSFSRGSYPSYTSFTSKVQYHAPGGFPPTSISGLLAWYDFNYAGNTVVSGAYSNVLDLSGNGYNLLQSTAANRPTQQVAAQNGLNTARFTSANLQRMSLAKTLNISNTYTCFAVCRRGGPSGTGVIELLGNTSNGNDATIEWWTNSVVYLCSTQGFINAGSQASATYNMISTAAAVNPTNSNVYFNGANIKSTVFTGSSAPDSICNVFGWADNTYCNGEIAEVLIYSGVLSTENRASVEAYLKSKWSTP